MKIKLLHFSHILLCFKVLTCYSIFLELRNDHTEITEKINQNIQVLHSAKPACSLSLSRDAGNSEIDVMLRNDTYRLSLHISVPAALEFLFHF